MSPLKIVAVLLIVAGALGLAYGSFSYTKETHSLKLGYAKGTSARVGSKLDTISIAWQFLWFDRPTAAGRAKGADANR